MQRKASIFLLFISLLISGCSSILTRSLARSVTPPPPEYFGGVRNDFGLIGESKKWDETVCAVVYGVVDMPFSFVADIVLIPYDVYTDCRYTNKATTH